MEKEKTVVDPKTFAESVNKKETKRNGNRNNFSVSKRKWKH